MPWPPKKLKNWWEDLFNDFVAQKPTFYVSGRFLKDNGNNIVVLRGVNLPLLDNWDFPAKTDQLNELAKTGSNAVRIQWYLNYPSPEDGGSPRPPYGIQDLNTILAKSREAAMVPIVELHDHTCNGDSTLLNGLIADWWTKPDVVQVLKSHSRYLIINLANELGNYRWADQKELALTAFKDAYKSAITKIRAAGLNMPIMVDAPDCGTSLIAFLKIGQELINHDPKHNIMLSVHAYWAAYPEGTKEIGQAVSANLPIVFGEIANKQDGWDEPNQQTLFCHYDIDGTDPNAFNYKNLLPLIGKQQIGWLAWSWWKDMCPERQMTSDGTIAGLTAYGKDLVSNSIYGLRDGKDFPAKKSKSLPGAPPK